MLLKFTATDMFNTSFVNVASGERAYDITTISVPSQPRTTKPPPEPLSSSQTAAPSEEFVPAKEYHTIPEPTEQNVSCRQTQIKDASGRLVADVHWEGRHPHITIDGEEIGGLNDFFGTSSIRFMPKVLAIPTKYSPDHVWTATGDSLTLVDYSTDEVKGTFHQNALRFPSPLKTSKPRLSVQTQLPVPPAPLSSSSPKSLFKSPSRIFSSSPSSPPPPPSLETSFKDKDCTKSTFVPTHVPGFGSNYLEFESHPLAKDVEIILSFLIMEIVRRGRFNLTPYTFDNPTIWQLKEARDLFLRRLRRNTV
ncbi:hypothetical protein AN958_00655 [Leucoagaricus sp. SymC.cos]|nr:hypothetical protein AN958_00655 [Leucoagaricus sp. SymC.cos]